jgi:hypothetical protein
MRALTAHAALVVAVSSGVVVGACGGGAGDTPPVRDPSTQGTASAPTSPPGVPPAPATAAPGAPGAGAPGVPATATPPIVQMKNVAPSAMAADLKEIGLDPKALPPLSKMEPEKLRKVMKTFTKALGTSCSGCHDPNDFRAWTPHKKVALGMWNEFVRGLAMTDGSLLYCDSCHQGAMTVLDRRDKKALSAWMDANFVAKLKRKAPKEHGCDTCHGEPFEPKFLAGWGPKENKGGVK